MLLFRLYPIQAVNPVNEWGIKVLTHTRWAGQLNVRAHNSLCDLIKLRNIYHN